MRVKVGSVCTAGGGNESEITLRQTRSGWTKAAIVRTVTCIHYDQGLLQLFPWMRACFPWLRALSIQF